MESIVNHPSQFDSPAPDFASVKRRWLIRESLQSPWADLPGRYSLYEIRRLKEMCGFIDAKESHVSASDAADEPQDLARMNAGNPIRQ